MHCDDGCSVCVRVKGLTCVSWYESSALLSLDRASGDASRDLLNPADTRQTQACVCVCQWCVCLMVEGEGRAYSARTTGR